MRTLLAVSLVVLFGGGRALAQVIGAPKIPVLVITGANNHDWEWTAPELQRVLRESGCFTVDITRQPGVTLADAAGIARYRCFVLDYNGPRWGEQAERNFIDAVRGGAGVSVIHAANNAFVGWREYEELVMLCWREGTGHGRFHAFDVEIVDADHPVTRGMPDLVGHPDELYHRLVHMHGAPYRVLAEAMSSTASGGTGEREPMIMVRSYGRGRVFHTPLGHVWRRVPASRASFADPQFRHLVSRGTQWAATGTVTLPPSAPNVLTPDEKAAGFRLLFDGKTTMGWRGFRKKAFPAAGWVVENGALHHVAKGGGGDIVTVEQFGDFDLRLEWAVEKSANSGIIYRCSEDEGASWRTGPEYQVLDDAGHAEVRPEHSAGALYGLFAPAGKILRPARHWNTARIVVRGASVEHWLNGVKVVSCRMDGEPWVSRVAASKFGSMPGFGRQARGHIALQDHGDGVWYRSIRIRPLE